MEINMRLGNCFDFSDAESLKQRTNAIIENTENEEGVSLLVIANTFQ